MAQHLNYSDVESLSNGRWTAILSSLGIPTSSLVNRHQPCPCCGGRDRFRFDDKNGSGSFICTHFGNGGGNGFQLVQHWFDCDFKTALKAVADVLGVGEGSTLPSFQNIGVGPHAIKDHKIALEQIWGECSCIDEASLIQKYLHSRGLDWQKIKGFDTEALRFHPALPYWDFEEQKNSMLGKFSAMVGKITDHQNNLQGLHFTYLQHVAGKASKLSIANSSGTPLTAKKMRNRYAGSLKGCAIQLYPSTEELAVCEGIETAFAIRETSGLPVWACLSANGLQSLTLPSSLKKLYIYCDNDLHAQGFRAGHNLMVRAIKSGVKAHIWQPKQLGWDALDVLIASKQEEAA